MTQTEMGVHIGGRLRDARLAKGMSCIPPAARLVVHPAKIARQERGLQAVTAVDLALLARLYGKPVAWFYPEWADA